jgi:hypothetical protein
LNSPADLERVLASPGLMSRQKAKVQADHEAYIDHVRSQLRRLDELRAEYGEEALAPAERECAGTN